MILNIETLNFRSFIYLIEFIYEHRFNLKFYEMSQHTH